MATCRKCIHWDECSIADGTTQFYGKEIAANNVEELCVPFRRVNDKAQNDDYISRKEVCEKCNNKGFNCGKEKCPVYKVPTANVAPIADTVRKIADFIWEKDIAGTLLPINGRYLSKQEFIDQIAKEMLESKE